MWTYVWQCPMKARAIVRRARSCACFKASGARIVANVAVGIECGVSVERRCHPQFRVDGQRRCVL
eukprot:5281934-Lingulodinium_polyedra.AAC.1